MKKKLKSTLKKKYLFIGERQPKRAGAGRRGKNRLPAKQGACGWASVPAPCDHDLS